MASIFSSICTEKCSNSARGLLSGFFRVSWTNSLSPSINCIRSNKLHANCKVRSHKLLQSGKELFANMLSIKGFSIFFTHFKHLQISDREIFLNFSNDFSYVKIAIWLNHSICSRLFMIYLLETDSPKRFFFVNSSAKSTIFN